MVEIFFVKWTIVKLLRLSRACVTIDGAPGFKIGCVESCNGSTDERIIVGYGDHSLPHHFNLLSGDK